ncbi:hypothetical protein [Denitrobaculum tricleocarpae]|uniref:Secreted protein n=1 Tax=Denitrobaculum tricleocarpae TaxID=2591009 RepID=A0A545TFU8_9PROT|nr:hypothetical protein [Denitrobaculum tricleocarpae]TQV76107.1 hypothetical protein FKG95_20895 [Denitrobaculum tricleocarpae]
MKFDRPSPVLAVALAITGLGLAGVGAASPGKTASATPDPVQANPKTSVSSRQISIAEAAFVVTLDNDPGTRKPYSYQSNQVPFLPGQSCYGWRLRLSDAGKVVSFREILTLPSDPAYWPHAPSEFDTTARFTDRTTTITERYVAPEEGWIGNGWCVLEGDPKGAYSVEVSINGVFAQRFDFEVGDPPASQEP